MQTTLTEKQIFLHHIFYLIFLYLPSIWFFYFLVYCFLLQVWLILQIQLPECILWRKMSQITGNSLVTECTIELLAFWYCCSSSYSSAIYRSCIFFASVPSSLSISFLKYFFPLVITFCLQQLCYIFPLISLKEAKLQVSFLFWTIWLNIVHYARINKILVLSPVYYCQRAIKFLRS